MKTAARFIHSTVSKVLYMNIKNRIKEVESHRSKLEKLKAAGEDIDVKDARQTLVAWKKTNKKAGQELLQAKAVNKIT